ncbi:hypothetical protein IPC1291_19930 [Pseudomonas aeruginosa]|nr:hypothetical protein IPC1291_19930 [Pseudomonas aeruginosa]
MTESKICTCPSGDGSLRWPCPKHPAVEQAGGDERVVDGKPHATKCPDCGEGDLMPGDLCACGYETDPAAGYACSECDGSDARPRRTASGPGASEAAHRRPHVHQRGRGTARIRRNRP